ASVPVRVSGCPQPRSRRGARSRPARGREERAVVPGTGTAVNVATVLLGATVGVLLGNRLPVRTRDVVTDALGLVTLLIAGTSAIAVLDDDLSDLVGDSAPMLIVLG